jgi:hypothetical protein
MTVARSVADVVSEHVVFEVDCIDRMYLNAYVPGLQYAPGLVAYVHRQLGLPIASTAPLAKITDAFSAAVHRFARDHGVPWVDFAKGQRKDDVMHEHLDRFPGAEGVLFVGRAQEKTTLFRTEKRRDAHGDSYPWIVKASGLVNQFYFYCVDADFGPFFVKFCSYFPYNAKLCLNGHEWAKRQAAKAGIGFTALDNGFAAVDDVAALQAICHQLGPQQIDALLRKWLARLPHPFSPADRAAGYRYELSILQAEFSLTQMLDRPVSGRVFFEQVIRDNLDIGRPDQVALVFDRRLRRRGPRATPGPFRTRVITDGSRPACTSTTSTPGSSSTTRKAGHYGPRPPSTTPPTFRSANGCTICPRCGRSASPPTGACCASKQSVTTRSPAPMPCMRSPRPCAPHPGPACPAYAWVNSAAKPCSPRCRCSDCNRAGSPTKTCARWSPSCAASPRRPSPPDKSLTICAACACEA